jgi:hypothetical protein
MTKLGDNTKLQTHMPGAKIQQTINFVVRKNKLIVWVSDSYVLGMTTWNSQDRIHIASSYVDEDDEAYVMSQDEIWYSIRGSVYGTYTIAEFNAKLTSLFKYFSAKEVDGHTHLSLTGNQQILTKDILNDDMEIDHTIDVGVTVDNLTVRIDNIEPYIITNIGASVKRNKGVFQDFYNDSRGAIDPDRRQPITYMQYSPVHMKRAFEFLTYNKDDHFTYMYSYTGKHDTAVFMEKTCSGTDNATEKQLWIMPQHCELEEE